jgi:hypothetical protein
MRIKEVACAGFFALLLLGLCAGLAFGQGQSGSISGTVYDQSGSVVPNAQITLTREGTGDIRKVQSNSEGFFSIVALLAGNYTVDIEFEGFNKWSQKGLTLTSGEKYTVRNIQLAPKTMTETIEVQASAAEAIPVDSIEKSATISSKQIQNQSIIGRSAVEMLKILPGVVVDETMDYQVASFGGGGIGGAVHVAGTRNDTVAMSVDGANTLDPGNNSGSSVTPNVEMVQEVKVQTAAMSAENSRGPTSVSAVSKSGSSQFHGEGYLYARNYHLNSQDWQANRYNFAKPQSSFYYPGFNVGGPVIIPGTSFNKNRDKLFFFAGFEWSRQQVDLGIDSNKSWVPTEKMRAGDFSELAGSGLGLGGYDTNGKPGTSINGTPYYDTNGVILNQNLIDPGGLAMLKMYPLPNRDARQSNGYNYISQLIEPQNRNQQLVRIDYSISDNTKLYSRFNHEGEVQVWPYCLWWNNSNQVPSPTPVTGGLRSYSVSNNLVTVLNPTTTNEVLFAATYYTLPFGYQDPTAMSRSGLNYPYQGMFKSSGDVIPNITDWSGGVGTMYQPGGLPHDAHKWTISADDNFSKVIGTHSLKTGYHFEFISNVEPPTSPNQGTITPTNWGGYSTGNAWADLLVGYIGAYNETSKNNYNSVRVMESAFYLQDSWKATRRLTLELGARFYHLGQAYSREGYVAAWDPTKYNPNAPATDFTGIIANYRDPSVSNSIWKTKPLRVSPRVGFAYDVTGKGTTVVRGGFGMFVYRDQFNAASGASANPPQQFNSSIGWGAGSLAGIDAINPLTNLPKSGLSVLDQYDERASTTYNWNFTISRRLPKSIVMEASYVGSRSVNQITPRYTKNQNAVPEGAIFGFPKGTNNDDYRPYLQYLNIATASHLLSQNYHSAQFTFNRQVGRFNFSLAYTFSKALGVGGDYYSGGGNDIDSFHWNEKSYGILPFDRTHVVSLAYVYTLPDFTKNKFAGGLINGWQFSGISQMQSGAPILWGGGSPFAIQYSGNMKQGHAKNADGTWNGDSLQINNRNITGSPDSLGRLWITCDPKSNLGSNGDFKQYFNPTCFEAPLPGINGATQLPYMHGPGFQNHDLSVFKNFKVSKDGVRMIQVRAAGYNVVNHPNVFFSGGDQNLKINFGTGADTGSNAGPNGVRNDSNPLTGWTTEKRGKRIIQFAIKFIF